MANTKYTIKPGDNLSSIASRYGTTVTELQKANGISNPNLIYAGGTLTIPKISADNGGGVASLNLEEKHTPYAYTKFEGSEYLNGNAEDGGLKGKVGDAESAVTNHVNGGFTFSKDQDYTDAYNLWMDRTKKGFSYDFNADALYQQYKDKYIEQGKMAMADTIGQASAMTGGYGNSYAATVGNQAYQASLSQLNDIVPELYQMAYDRYNQEGQDILNTLGMLNTEYDKEYGKYTDKYGMLVNDRDYYNTAYNNQYNREYDEHITEEGYKYATNRDEVTDAQWKKTYDLSDRELKMAEDAWDLEKKQANNPVKVINTPKDDKPKDDVIDYDNKATYADWDASDWEGYFARIRQTEGKSSAEKELKEFTSKGLIPQNFVGVAAIGARGSGGGH